MPGARLTAIIPTKSSISSKQGKRAMAKSLQTFAFEAQRIVQKYPSQLPPTGSGQSIGGRGNTRKRSKTGLTGYKRTGTLGRNWGITERSETSITVENRTPYAVYVEGPVQGPGPGQRQAATMAERGWPSVDHAAAEALKKAVAKFEEISITTEAI